LSIDEGVQKLMDSLRASGQLENTIVVFTSDQGLAMGHHGMTIKVAPYDDNIRIPFIVRLPEGRSGGRAIDAPVNVIDLIPTFFDYAGIDLPWEMHGDNLRPLLENPRVKWDRPILQENFSKSFGSQTRGGRTIFNAEKGLPNQNVDWWIFLRAGNFKYIRTLVEDEIEELYNIENDPRELTNLALDPAYQDILGELRERMVLELKNKKAALVDNMPLPRKL
jgi:arylsulfatase A-like enzyme